MFLFALPDLRLLASIHPGRARKAARKLLDSRDHGEVGNTLAFSHAARGRASVRFLRTFLQHPSPRLRADAIIALENDEASAALRSSVLADPLA